MVGELELNKIYNMDCLEGIKQLDDKSINVVITDPPYNIGKDDWDRIYNYQDWFISWINECDRVLKDNGTFWFFHIDFNILAQIHNRIIKETSFRHKQLIIIDKGKQSIAGRTSDILRSYPRATEYLQFYTYQDGIELNTIKLNVNNFQSLRNYFKEFQRSLILTKKQVIDTVGQCTDHCFRWNSTQWDLPTKETYEQLCELPLKSEFVKKEYEDLRKEYEDLRYTFNLQTGYTDVWKINFYRDTIDGHSTPKPLSLIKRIIKTSTVENDIVLDPFIGSGTTAVVSKQLNRNFIGFEINPEYCKMANKRIQKTVVLNKWF